LLAIEETRGRNKKPLPPSYCMRLLFLAFFVFTHCCQLPIVCCYYQVCSLFYFFMNLR
jgi:hypothetical protein